MTSFTNIMTNVRNHKSSNFVQNKPERLWISLAKDIPLRLFLQSFCGKFLAQNRYSLLDRCDNCLRYDILIRFPACCKKRYMTHFNSMENLLFFFF